MKLSKEFKAGLLIVVAILLMYWGINFLKGNDIFAPDRFYYVVYENTEGLNVAKPVNINGFKIGQISEMYFHPDLTGKIVVKFIVINDYPIPSNSIAKIHNMSLLGEKAIAIDLGSSFELAEPGDTLIGAVDGSLTDEMNEQIGPIKTKVENLLGSLDTAVGMVRGFLTDQTRKNFNSTFVNLSKTFENLESASRSLDEVLTTNQQDLGAFIQNLASISENLKNNNEALTVTISNFSSITDTIVKADIYNTFAQLNSALRQADTVMQKINNGDGSIGMLINDPQLYDNLKEASNSLNRLILDIKYNPNKYVQFSVFGSKQRFSDEDIEEIEAERKKRQEEKEKNGEQDASDESKSKKD